MHPGTVQVKPRQSTKFDRGGLYQHSVKTQRFAGQEGQGNLIISILQIVLNTKVLDLNL